MSTHTLTHTQLILKIILGVVESPTTVETIQKHKMLSIENYLFKKSRMLDGVQTIIARITNSLRV